MLILWGLGGSLAGAQAAPSRANCPPDKSGLCVREDYRIQLSDVLEIHFPFSSEYDEAVTVQPDGFIRLREVSPIHAAGLNVPELETAILQSYRPFLKDPVVSIVLKDFQKPSFYASGEVGRPGRYDLRSNLTLVQALAEAGGLLNERGAKKQVILMHPESNSTYRTRVVDVRALLNDSGIHEDVLIRPGDVIYVPQKKMSKIARFIPSPSMGAYLGPGAF